MGTAMMGLPDLNPILGPLVLGAWISTYLLSAQIIQAAKYFHRYNDPYWIKAVVAFSLVTISFSTACIYTAVYMYTVTHWGDPSFLVVQPLVASLNIAGTAISGLATQLFLIGRLGRLIPNIAARSILVAILAILSVVSCVGSLWTAGILIQYPLLPDRGRSTTPTFVWLIITAAVDVLIALSLIFVLWFVAYRHIVNASQGVSERTKSIIRKVMVRSIETGLLTALLALATLAAFLRNSHSNVFVAFNVCMGPMYGLTLLASLNGRQMSTDGSTIKNTSHSVQPLSTRSHHLIPVHVGPGFRPMRYGESTEGEQEERKDTNLNDLEVGVPESASR